MESLDTEFVPEILPVDARLSLRGPVAVFIKLFERAASVTPTKEVILGTGYALLEAFQTSATEVSHVRITATDGDQTVSVVVDGVTVLMEGAVLVPGKKFLDILKLAPTAEVKIEVLGNTATLRSGRAQWTVQTPVGDSLPPLPNVDSIELQEVLRVPFLKALVVARASASSTSARSSLMQVQLRSSAITGCDGGRLHRQRIEDFPADIDMTIPIKVVDELIRQLKVSTSPYLSLGSNDYHLVFRIEQDSIIAQRLLVAFPDVENLLLGPAFSNQNTLTVDTTELAAVVSRIRVNADPDYSAIFLALIPGKLDTAGSQSWLLAVRAKDRNGNSSQEVIECQYVGSGKSRELCVNHRYLSEFLSSYPDVEAVFKLGDDTKSIRYPLFLEDEVSGFTGFVQQMNPAYLV